MPLVWASKLQGTPLPTRIAGSALVWDLMARAERDGRSVYLLGGLPEGNAGAANVFREKFPTLNLVGNSSPWISLPPTETEIDAIHEVLKASPPDLLLVGFGSPKQELVIEALRTRFPGTWMVGVGVSFSFAAGQVSRAPVWMQKSGLEWVHRMAQDPKRLIRRYLIEDLPFAFRLFGQAAWRRFTSHAS